MKYELNFYKPTGKWYTSETVEKTESLAAWVDYPLYTDMDYTVHIIEPDGYLQPFRMCKR